MTIGGTQHHLNDPSRYRPRTNRKQRAPIREERVRVMKMDKRSGKAQVSIRVLYPMALSLLAICASPVAFAESSNELVNDASRHHEHGLELFQAENYEGAAMEFQRAQALSPTPANLINLARCYERLGQLEEAIRLINLYLNESSLSSERRERAYQLRRNLTDRLREIPQEPRERRSFRRIAPWILMGSGAVLSVIGMVLDIQGTDLIGGLCFTVDARPPWWRMPRNGSCRVK